MGLSACALSPALVSAFPILLQLSKIVARLFVPRHTEYHFLFRMSSPFVLRLQRIPARLSIACLTAGIFMPRQTFYSNCSVLSSPPFSRTALGASLAFVAGIFMLRTYYISFASLCQAPAFFAWARRLHRRFKACKIMLRQTLYHICHRMSSPVFLPSTDVLGGGPRRTFDHCTTPFHRGVKLVYQKKMLLSTPRFAP